MATCRSPRLEYSFGKIIAREALLKKTKEIGQNPNPGRNGTGGQRKDVFNNKILKLSSKYLLNTQYTCGDTYEVLTNSEMNMENESDNSDNENDERDDIEEICFQCGKVPVDEYDKSDRVSVGSRNIYSERWNKFRT
ncbi:hypothetical protein RclHR1_00100025 [Rhizophagus clarus]|uniref:Uncharacterized protein n=1 Tax=Rhizophagus clarus TaxID=94130 RepID=A0A2Z6QEN8_9GLOM|nr:hypothetical protein RclHR1_00100025 [Rhizophagus clarus]